MNPSRLPALAAAHLALAAVSVATTAFAADPLPPAVQALQKRGATIAGTFTSVTGLKVYAAVMGGQPMPLYALPDGKHVIAGMALNEAGESADEAALQRTVAPPLGEATWKQLEASHWIADGHASAPRIVYVFTDPNCPYCSRLWADARPWIDSGKVQIRHIIIDILGADSAPKASALLADADPSGLFTRYEGARAQALGKSVAGVPANARPGDIIKPSAAADKKAHAWVEANDQLMASLGLFATPGVVWRDAHGEIQKRAGIPPGLMPEVFGPR